MSKVTNTYRVAVVAPRLSRYGGAEGFAWRFADALAREGYAVDFICARAEVDAPQGVRPVTVGRFGPFKVMKALWFACAAEKAVRKGEYDLVFGQGKFVGQDILRVGGGPQKIFWRLSKLAWDAGFPRFWKMLRRRISLANHVSRWIEKRRNLSAGTIVAVSELVRDWILEAYPELDASRVRVIYNRPDLNRFSPVSAAEREQLRREQGIAPNDVIITTAGTNFTLKGVKTLLRALTLLPDHYRLRVAGGRNPESYIALAEKLGVADRVEFCGRVEDMSSFYRSGDVFVLSTFYDACSNAVLEAMACGCRSLSSAMNGSSVLLPPEWVFPDPGDHVGVAKCIQNALDGPGPEAFTWPEDVPVGMGEYMNLVREFFERKDR